MKSSWFAILTALLAILFSACTSATPEPDAGRPPLPTANVPPVTDIDMAIDRWEDSNITRYFADLEERNSENNYKVRLTVADGQVRAAQRLEMDSNGNWGEPVSLPLDEARNYTVEALLARVRRDATGSGPAPVNLKVAFDANSGFPAVVHAEAMPVYDEEGKIILDRRYSYDLTLGVRPLLEDNYEVGRTPILTLIRSGGHEAWCDSLKVYDDGAMIYTDDCRDRLLRLTLPESRQKVLNDLRNSFEALDELDQDGDQSQHLTLLGTGEGLPDQDELKAAWELSLEAHTLASDPVGLGLAMGYLYQGTLIGFDIFNKQTLPSQLMVEGEISGAAIQPSGGYIAYSDDAGLKVMEIETSQVTLLLPSPDEGYHSPRGWSAGGRLLASLVSESAAPDEQFGWISLEDNGWHPVPRPEGVSSYGCDTGVAWSPEGERLAISGIEYGHPCNTAGGLTIVAFDSGEARRIVAPAISPGLAGSEAITAGAHTPAWSLDGNWIAFGLDQDANAELSFPTRLYRVHADGSQLTPLTDNSQGVAAYPAWAPDGSLYYSLSRAGAENDGIYRYIPADNTHTLLIPGTDLYPVSVSPDNGFLVYKQANELKIWSIFLNEAYAGITGEEGAPPEFAGWLQATEQP